VIKILTDHQLGQYSDGTFVPITIGIDIAEVKKNLHGPCGTALAYYKQALGHDFQQFMVDFMTKPTGTALGGRLEW